MTVVTTCKISSNELYVWWIKWVFYYYFILGIVFLFDWGKLHTQWVLNAQLHTPPSTCKGVGSSWARAHWLYWVFLTGYNE